MVHAAVHARFWAGMKVLAAGTPDLKSITAAQPFIWHHMSAAGRSQSRPWLMQWSRGRLLAVGLSNRAVWLAGAAQTDRQEGSCRALHQQAKWPFHCILRLLLLQWQASIQRLPDPPAVAAALLLHTAPNSFSAESLVCMEQQQPGPHPCEMLQPGCGIAAARRTCALDASTNAMHLHPPGCRLVHHAHTECALLASASVGQVDSGGSCSWQGGSGHALS